MLSSDGRDGPPVGRPAAAGPGTDTARPSAGTGQPTSRTTSPAAATGEAAARTAAKATVVMPEGARLPKIEATRSYGASAPTGPGAARGGPARHGPAKIAGAARALLARHRVFVIALAAGAALRVAAELGYRWAIWFNDSFDYIAVALRLRPDPVRPIGYPLFLWLLRPAHSLALVTSLQHLLGLGCAVAVYALLRERFAMAGWAATLAAAPVLLDAFQIQLEQLLLADTLFTFLVVVAIILLCWHADGARTGVAAAAAAGALLAAAALTRPVGIPLIVTAICYLAIRRAGWRAVTAAATAAAAPLAGYVLAFHAVYGQYALGQTDGIYLWGRVAAFAECGKIKPPPAEAWLCPALPPAQRAASSSQVWQPGSPFHWQHGQTFGAADNDLALRFALRAIAAQPGDYARALLAGIGRSFTWDRAPYPTAYTASLYTFAGAKTWLPGWLEPGGRTAAGVAQAYAGGHAATVKVAPYAGVMRWYQRYVYVRGTLAGLVLLIPPAVGLSRSAARARRRGRQARGRDASASTGAEWLCWSAAVVLLVIPPMTVDFDYRYVLPVVPLGCVAAALAIRRLATAAGQRAHAGA